MIATIILMSLSLIRFGVELAKHGQPRKGEYNGTAYFVSMIISATLFYYAGIFNNFN